MMSRLSMIRAWAAAIVLMGMTVQAKANEQGPDLLKGANISLYSDADEKSTSRSKVKLEQVDEGIALHYYLPEHPEIRYCYAGLSIPFHTRPSADAQTLEFDVRISEGAAQPFSIILRTDSDLVYRRAFSPYGEVTTQWRTLRIPLSDLTVPENERTNLNNLRLSVASHSMRDDIDLMEGTFYLRNVRFTNRPAAGTVDLPDYRTLLRNRKVIHREPGHAAWVYTMDQTFVDQIANFNASSAVPINLLFVSAGEIGIHGDQAHMSPLKEEDLRWYMDRVGEGVEVYAMIGSMGGRDLAAMSPEQQAKIARQVAERLEQVEGLAGAHFDIEPYVIDALPFYIAFKQATDLPLSVAINKWDEHIMWVADFPAVMAYGKAREPAAYAQSAGTVIDAFARAAAEAERTFYAGVVLAHTNLEYEYQENAATGERMYTGFQMEEYTEAVLDRISRDSARSPWFGGVGIWAFMPEKSKTHADFPKHPRQIKAECFEQLERFSRDLARQAVAQ